MKKFLSLILSFITVCVAGTVFSSVNTPKTVIADSGNEAEEVWNSWEDFSGIQGYKNWYYLHGADDLSTAQYMIFDIDYCVWRSGADENCLMEKHISHPGQLIQAIRAWRAPYSGTFSVETDIQRRPVAYGGDGNYCYISKGFDDVLDDIVLTTDDLDIVSFDIANGVQMQEGEVLYFVLNCSGNYTNDQTYWNITIKPMN